MQIKNVLWKNMQDEKLEMHVKILGVLWIIIGFFMGLAPTIGGILIGGIGLGAVMFLGTSPLIIAFIGGIALLKHKKWAKILILIFGVLILIYGIYNLVRFTIGTLIDTPLVFHIQWIFSILLGIYTLLILMNSQTNRIFGNK
jgi:hypothetical protein